LIRFSSSSRTWILFTWLTLALALLLQISCEGVASSRQNSGSGAASAQLEQTLWSPTLYWSGIRFRFELTPGEENLTPRYLHEGNSDILRVGNRQVTLKRTRFQIDGAYFNWPAESIIWIHRIPDPERPFYRREGALQLTWVGDGKHAVVEEQRQDGTIVWTLATARVTRRGDGTVLYSGRGPDVTRSGPWKLLLGPRGEIVAGSS